MNVTWRARVLLLVAVAGLAIGILLRREPVALSGLMLAAWIGMEWFRFQRRTLRIDRAFAMRRRTVEGQPRSGGVIVVDQELEVVLDVGVDRRLSGLRCAFEDVVPGGCRVVAGATRLVADVRGGEVLRWSYRVQGALPGHVALPGLQVIVNDLQGLFRVRRFLPLLHELNVLPFLVRPQATTSILKPQNVQILPGTHRHRRPGLSTELLGIRDYRTGDPPRSIAWKATARLGKLMTCEYESEVPVRATVLADLSPAHFAGRPGPARADRIISAAASIARLLLADRDPVAGLMVSGSRQTWLPHGLGERHLSRWLLRLLSAAPTVAVEDLDPVSLTELAWTCAFHRFPELFDPTVNPPRARSFRWGRRRRATWQRRQLAFALAELHREDVGTAIRIQYDDRLYRDHCRRLLSAHPGLVDLPAAPVLATPPAVAEREAVDALCRGLLSGVARAADNELFVIVGAAPSGADGLERLESTVRVARGAHHRVLFIDAGSDASPPAVHDPLAARILSQARHAQADPLAQLRQRLGRLGAKAARLEDPRLTEQVAAEIEILKSGRARIPQRG